MSTQEKRPISVRLPAELVRWAEEYGRARRWDRSTVIVAALEALRGDAAGGVPELEEGSAPAVRDAGAKPAARAASVAGGQQPAVASASRRVPAPGVRRGSDVLGPEPNVDRFEKTDDYRRAMALYRTGRPWQSLMRDPK